MTLHLEAPPSISVVFKLCKKEVNTLKEDNVIINENSSNVIYSAVFPPHTKSSLTELEEKILRATH